MNIINKFNGSMDTYWKYHILLPIVIGILFMYIPTFSHLSETTWKTDDQGHGPLVLMVVLFVFWQQRYAFFESSNEARRPIVGLFFLVISLFSYTIGRSQDILLLDVGSLIPLLVGVILIYRGTRTLVKLWFPLFFILFMIPLPGVIVDSVTLPMKMGVSYLAEHVLFWFNYPIARSGVILHIGQYQLLVADACAGMHTLISLEALGLLYLNLVKHDSLIRNISLAILILPISITANVTRVIVLTLITYHFGDEAGQSFIHGFAGMVLFVVALTLIISLDSLLQYLSKIIAKKNNKVISEVGR